ncbi:MAG TPA: hypothetical protein VFG23_10640 [Polyangia bacterium]|nr:hypothetical protein [Polyangia bacterium]
MTEKANPSTEENLMALNAEEVVPCVPAIEVAMGHGWSAELEQRTRGAVLRIHHPDRGAMSVEITLTANGPSIRTTAATLEIDATADIFARCEKFTVEARQRISLRAPEIVQQASDSIRAEARAVEIVATAGDIRLRANDDVQVLGDQVLLNCEREPPLPNWLPRSPDIEITVPREDTGGDLDVLEWPPLTQG